MTVLHLISTFPPLTETFILREIRQLRKTGLEVMIAPLRPLHRTPSAEGFEDLNSSVIDVSWFSVDMLQAIFYFSVRVPFRVLECLWIVFCSITRPKLIFKMLYVLLTSMRLGFQCRKMKIDFMRADFLHTQALAARFLHALLGLNYGITVYTTKVYYSGKVLDQILKRATWFVVDTQQADDFLRSLAVSHHRIFLLRNGVSVDDFPHRLREPDSGPPIILGVGTLIPKKGFHDLLSACRILKDHKILFHCILIGDGDGRQRLEQLTDELALADTVEMLGYLSLSELHRWYYRASMLIMPSIVDERGETDGLPTVVIEALAAGLPVVGTRTAGIPEAIENGVNGILVPAHSPETLAEAIEILITDQHLRERFSVEGRKKVEQEFNLEKKVAALRDLIIGRTSVVPTESDESKGQLSVAS